MRRMANKAAYKYLYDPEKEIKNQMILWRSDISGRGLLDVLNDQAGELLDYVTKDMRDMNKKLREMGINPIKSNFEVWVEAIGTPSLYIMSDWLQKEQQEALKEII